MTAPETKTAFTKLTPGNIIALSAWLSARKDELLENKPSYAETAKKAGEAIGATVSVDMLKRVAEASEMLWEPAKAVRLTKDEQIEMLKLANDSLKARNEELQEQLELALQATPKTDCGVAAPSAMAPVSPAPWPPVLQN